MIACIKVQFSFYPLWLCSFLLKWFHAHLVSHSHTYLPTFYLPPTPSAYLTQSTCQPGHIPTHLTRSVRTWVQPPRVIVSACKVASISFNCSHFSSHTIFHLLLLSFEKEMTNCLCWYARSTGPFLSAYICAVKKWSLSQENMQARKNMPYCCPQHVPPPCNGTRNMPCCSENMQLALK